MKLLFDQNLSFRILKQVREVFPDCAQVRMLGLENARDLDIWLYARDHGYTIVTFDSDFFDLTVLKGHPPKIIWLRLGNTSTEAIANWFLQHEDLVRDFISGARSQELGCLEVEA